MVKARTRRGPAAHVRHGEYSAASRALALGTYFISGCMAINTSQFLGAPLYLINEDWYNAWIAFTKQSWGLLTASMTQCWAPTVVRVSGHKSIRGELLQTTEGNLLSNFPERLIMIANHQIYTDWLYLWWIGYTNGMHGRIYVVLKESLRRIPVIGWGMQFSQFIFLKRNWEQDKDRLASHLQKLNDAVAPMWLMIFPEGTNLHPMTRKVSKKWADKNKIPDMQHQLLPRSKGLQFCIQQLRDTVPYVYDCTIAYEGVRTGEYASEIFTIQAAYFGGKPPKSVNMYWRRFEVSSIPVDDEKGFDNWLRARWIEKDQLLDHYQRTGRFPADNGVDEGPDGKKRRGAGYVETEIKPNKWYEYLQIFAPVGLLALILYMFYGGLPKRFMNDAGKQVAQQSRINGPEDLEQLAETVPRVVEVDSTNASIVEAPTQIAATTKSSTRAKKAIRKLPPRKVGVSKVATGTRPTAQAPALPKSKQLEIMKKSRGQPPKLDFKIGGTAAQKPPKIIPATATREGDPKPAPPKLPSSSEPSNPPRKPKKLEIKSVAETPLSKPAPTAKSTLPSKKPPDHKPAVNAKAKKSPPAVKPLSKSKLKPALPKEPNKTQTSPAPAPAAAAGKENRPPPRKLEIKPKANGLLKMES